MTYPSTYTHRRLRRPRTANHRNGFLLFDLVVGFAALAVILTGTLVVIASLKHQREINHQHFLATQYLANIAETIDGLPDTREIKIALPDNAQHELPGAKLTIEIEPITPIGTNDGMKNGSGEDSRKDQQTVRQIHCTLRWSSTNSTPDHQTTLTLWKSNTDQGRAGETTQ